MWLLVAQRDQRQIELLEEVLRFGEPAPTLGSSMTPASTTSYTSTMHPIAIELDVVHDAVVDQVASSEAWLGVCVCPPCSS